jgi:hypothetical protein
VFVGILAIPRGGPLVGRSEPATTERLTMDDLQRMCPDQLAELFVKADVGSPLVGPAHGRLIYSTDKHPRMKMWMSNAVWKGKLAAENGYFINRWIGGIKAIDSHYVIGPSWVDGRPAIIMEYASGTPLFANSRDELREVAPGLYLGPLFDRCPCPKLRGYLALQIEVCAERHGLRRR